jgi:uncharacterized protein YhbP (UPF0306 family)
MVEDKTNEIQAYLNNHSYLGLAVSYKDKPYAATMKYVADGLELYFAIFRSSYTSSILMRNNYVACTIDDHSIEEFVQIVGEAIVMDSKEDREKAGKILASIYSHVSFWIYSNEVFFYKIRPYRIKYTLGTKNFKNTESFGKSYELIIKND